MNVRFQVLWVVLFFLIPVSAALPSSNLNGTPSEPDYWPTDGWLFASPESQGMDSRLLDLLDAKLNSYELCYNAFLVVHHGYIVFETYPNPAYDENQLHFLASVTKSVTAGIFGIAVDEGYIGNIQDPVLAYFPNRTVANPNPLKDMIAVRDLLTMKTGLQWDEGTYSYDDSRNSFVQWIQSEDSVQFFLDLPMECAPNWKWYYNTGASSMLSTLITVTSGESMHHFAAEHLFQPLGITRHYWESDRQGINYGGFGLSLLPRDMAKYGFLYLHKGRWEQQQVISEEWVVESTQMHTMFCPGYGYGYHWIIYPIIGAYAAFGAGGQGICVIPQHDLVIVVTAEEPDGVPFLNLVKDYVLSSLSDSASTPNAFVNLAGFLALIFGIAASLLIINKYTQNRRIHRE
ncbi:MAG: serine hydrolase domain-containing protein [Promethearchaeota archaeon]